MIGWRLLLLGVFLTPFTRLLPIPDFGLSIGDIALITGSLFVLIGRARGERPPSARLSVFLVPGALIVASTLLSAVVNQAVSAVDTVVLVTQYAVVFVLLPVVFAREGLARVAQAAKAFLYGLGASIAIGLVIISFLPGVEASLIARGWLYSVGGDRYGLFAGIGELAKMAAMGLGLLYYLTLRGHLGVFKAGALLGAFLVSLVVTRSGSGAATAAVVVAVLALLHSAVRGDVRRYAPTGAALRGLLVAAAGAIGGGLALRELDGRGANYGEAFLARVVHPLSDQGYEGVGSARLREQLIEQAWQVIGQYPVFGIGPGLYHEDALYGQGAHVVPLMLWAETGILAMVGWIVLIVALGVSVMGSLRSSPVASVATGGVLVGLLATHLSAPYMYGRGLFLPMLLAFYLLSERLINGHAASARPVRPRLSPSGL